MKNISLKEARKLEGCKMIKIFNPNTVHSHLSSNYPWRTNFISFKDKHSQIPLSKLWQMFDYRIESKLIDGEEIGWTYVYGKKIN
jgi:hypothetical protein